MEERTLEQMILSDLQDIRESQQDIRERLAKVETMLHERTDDTKELRDMLKSHEDRITDLEAHKSSNMGAREIVAFLIMAGLALLGVLK